MIIYFHCMDYTFILTIIVRRSACYLSSHLSCNNKSSTSVLSLYGVKLFSINRLPSVLTYNLTVISIISIHRYELILFFMELLPCNAAFYFIFYKIFWLFILLVFFRCGFFLTFLTQLTIPFNA